MEGRVMNARKVHLVIEERKKLQVALGSSFSGYKVRCVTAVARNILLQGRYQLNGRSCNPVAKSIGAGVYEVWLEEEGK